MGYLLANVLTLAQAAPAAAATMAPKVEQWPAVTFGSILIACVFAVSIMRARRTHLD